MSVYSVAANALSLSEARRPLRFLGGACKMWGALPMLCHAALAALATAPGAVAAAAVASPTAAASASSPTRMLLPSWSAPKPDGTRLQGYAKIRNLTDHVVYRPESTDEGLYNHAAMIMYHAGTITVSWKNAPSQEDTPGQRVLFSQTTDGVAWSKAEVLFPTMDSKQAPSAQFAGPFAVLNGRLYASASPAVIGDGDAQGAQFCQWPDGLDTRNCNCPGCGGKQPKGLLMLRQVQPGGVLGPVFWGTKFGPPHQYKDVAKAAGVKPLAEMDVQTQADVKALAASHGIPAGHFQPPCSSNDTGSGTLKCEACPNGCQIYSDSPKSSRLANERAYYPLPGGTADVQLFRAHSGTLWGSVRGNISAGQEGWSAVAETTIPNDNSNLNAGVLPGKAMAKAKPNHHCCLLCSLR
jgi:hypothetical protein